MEMNDLSKDYEFFSMQESLQEVLQFMKVTAQAVGVSIKQFNKEDVIINSNKSKVQQVVMNLVSNATKFAPPNTTVEVKSAYNKETSVMKIQVSDCGPGIYPKDFDKLFKPYSKLKSGKKINPDGLGLSLFISKRIIEKLDGSITFRSKPKVKTTFEIKFKANIIMNLDTVENLVDMKSQKRDA